jgi:transposase-like protein
MGKKKKTYVATPEPPPELRDRYQVMLEVLSGKITVSEGARRLGIERNHFQSMMHRGLEGFIQGMSPKPSGRPAKNPKEANLEAENERLRKHNAKLQDRVDTIDRLLGVASDMLKGRVEPKRRARRTAAETQPETEDDSEEPDGEARRKLEGATAMIALGLSRTLAAAIAGVSSSTLRRWKHQSQSGLPLRERRGPAVAPVPPERASEAIDVVRRLAGQIGVRALAKQVPDLSRSQATELKHQALTAMERERKASAARIEITIPGLVRGFDAMHVQTLDGPRWLLVAADASIPFRTTGLLVEHYDGPSVALALENDITCHGAPLAYRLDRWRAHVCPDVLAVLKRHGVLILHGPPYYPCFYGQLERQNGEQRVILDALGTLAQGDLARHTDAMLDDLNSIWPRKSLGWRTPRQVWDNRPRVEVNRDSLQNEVRERAARIAARSTTRNVPKDFFERIAFERALAKRGYLRRPEGGWC